MSRGNLALLLWRRGETYVAEKHERFVPEARRCVLEPRDPDTLVAMANQAHTLRTSRGRDQDQDQDQDQEEDRDKDADRLFGEVSEIRMDMRIRQRREKREEQKGERRRARLRHLPGLLQMDNDTHYTSISLARRG